MNTSYFTITYPNGTTKEYGLEEFEMFNATNELEHLHDKIIVNVIEPHLSFIYETDERGEIVYKEFINAHIHISG